MITSTNNPKLRTIRRLQRPAYREATGLFVAEGEDLIAAADAAGQTAAELLEAGRDVEPQLLQAASSLGSGSRVIGIYRQRWARPGGRLSVYLQGVGDPANVGAIIRCAHAFCDGPVVCGPNCADPYSPKAVRASMGSVFARPPARASFSELEGTPIALTPHADAPIDRAQLKAPAVLCLGAERDGLSAEVAGAAQCVRIPMRAGAQSLNVATAAAIALYELTRMATCV